MEDKRHPNSSFSDWKTLELNETNDSMRTLLVTVPISTKEWGRIVGLEGRELESIIFWKPRMFFIYCDESERKRELASSSTYVRIYPFFRI